jgi:tetratricopeptide (TPR) repeat protein
MTYWSYYVAWTLFAYMLRQPWLLVGVGVFLLLRRIIPDPTAVFRAFSRSGSLRSQVDVNPANVTARRDLAQIYLDVRRPRAALKLVQQALVRTPNEPEMLYLAGLAQHRVGKHEDALPNLVRAVELDPRVRFGLPYLVAGDALFALRRYEEAADAFERYSESNTSDVSAYVRLARTYARLGKTDEARQAIDEAESTWRVLPSRMRQRTFLKGYLGPRWARVTVLKEPGAILGAVALAFAFAGVCIWLYPTVAQLW